MTSASASRVTRSRRSLQRLLLLAGFVFAGVTLLEAQEGPPPAPAAEQTEAAPTPAVDPSTAQPNPAAGTPAQSGSQPAPSTSSAPAASAAEPSPDASQRPVGPTPNRFEPTEKVRADFDVSFPVDI